MAEKARSGRQMSIRHRGRGSQVFIYFGKLLRMFVYQNDWKVLPMAALIAGLVGMVVRRRFFINMEGTLMGSFAMVCVCIWNGCFNSIQVICRERDVIKREHRSGMHISSYIFSHMLYQALLCLGQTAVTLYVTMVVGVKYPREGLITPFFYLDFAVSMFLITYASDMMCLWISSLAHVTTTAMTIMPFVLIFQLVFSGGLLTLPAWTQPLTNFTISNPGLKVVAVQADTNHRPYATISQMITKMRDNEVGGTVTIGQLLDMMQDAENPTVAELRNMELGGVFTLGEVEGWLNESATFAEIKEKTIIDNVTVRDVIDSLKDVEELDALTDQQIGNTTLKEILNVIIGSDEMKPALDKKIVNLTTVGDMVDAIQDSGVLDAYRDTELGGTITLGELVDMAAGNADIQARRDEGITVTTTVGKLLDLVGEENVKTFLEEKAAEANYNADYDFTVENVTSYWLRLVVFILAFALLSTITLEFIDKDKR